MGIQTHPKSHLMGTKKVQTKESHIGTKKFKPKSQLMGTKKAQTNESPDVPRKHKPRGHPMLPRKHKPKNHLTGTKEALDESGMCLCSMLSYPVGLCQIFCQCIYLMQWICIR